HRTLQEKNLKLTNFTVTKHSFLNSMINNMNTTLNAILSITGKLLMKLPSTLTTDQEKQLRTVQGSARHLLSLINDLLDLAKIDSGKVELHREPLVCQEVVQEVAASLAPAAQARGLELETTFPPFDVVVHADRRALRQIL